MVDHLSNVVLCIASTFDFALVGDDDYYFCLRSEGEYVFVFVLTLGFVVGKVDIQIQGFLEDREPVLMVDESGLCLVRVWV